MTRLIRPLVQSDHAKPEGALRLAGGWCWFKDVEIVGEGIRGVEALTDDEVRLLTAPRAPLLGLAWERPRTMAILNVTPDSFSDGGQFSTLDETIAATGRLKEQGADILDIGGESTRPGASLVPEKEEITRTEPVIKAASGMGVPISIDTRKAEVAKAALQAGAAMMNDVSALRYDPAMAAVAARAGVPVCLMHAQGEPKHMQSAPRYEDVLAEVYAFLQERIEYAEAAGIPRDRIVVDPGIGFGKTLEHNLILLANLSVFHGLGCVVLLGASRKSFIAEVGGAPEPRGRVPGSLAVALSAVAQGVQILRVHDMAETTQALALERAVRKGRWYA